jgi:hypothetical protein
VADNRAVVLLVICAKMVSGRIYTGADVVHRKDVQFLRAGEQCDVFILYITIPAGRAWDATSRGRIVPYASSFWRRHEQLGCGLAIQTTGKYGIFTTLLMGSSVRDCAHCVERGSAFGGLWLVSW